MIGFFLPLLLRPNYNFPNIFSCCLNSEAYSRISYHSFSFIPIGIFYFLTYFFLKSPFFSSLAYRRVVLMILLSSQIKYCQTGTLLLLVECTG